MSAGRPSALRGRLLTLLPPSRLTLLGCYLVLILAQLIQRGTLVTFDTKLDLLVDPGRLLARTLTLWSPQLGMGSLQNQAYGYLFPIGPIFWLAHTIGLAPWLTERLWSAAVSIVAFEGARRLARAWGGLGWRAALLVGVAYVASPRFLSETGTLTGELLPAALLPWVVLPLLRLRRGTLWWPRAVVLSALAVAAMGGLNAAAVVATLPLPAILLLSAARQRQIPWRALPAWAAAVLAGCCWWLGPLVLLGRYSPPFLDFIESSSNTTAVLGWVNATRGADNWVGYLAVGGHAWWPAAYALDRTDWLVVATALVAGVSLAGLLGQRVRDRGVLLGSVAVGLICLVAAHGGGAGGLVADPVRALLDGSLAPLRNVHKVDPLIRLPFALGFGFAAHEARVRVADRIRRSARLARLGRPSVAGAIVAGAIATTLLAVSAQPVAGEQLRQLPGWTAIPGPWQRAATALDALPSGSRVLVLPASGMGLQTWGWTIDEPIQPLTTTAWASRGQAPLVPPASVRWQDAIDDVLASGQGGTGLTAALARAGFTDVLLRTDLDPQVADAPPPSVVAATLLTSPGISRVATFGIPPGADLPISLWHIGGAVPARARVAPVGEIRTVQGGPEAVPALLAAHLLRPDQPVELIGQQGSPPAGTAPSFLTDTLQRREQSFGRVNDAQSSIMTADDSWQLERGTHEYPAFAGERQTVAFSFGLASVTATSSGGYADILGPIRPDEGPYEALDSDDSTAWVSAPFTDPVGQALSITLRTPTVLRPIVIHPWQAPGAPAVTEIRVTTDAGSASQVLAPGQQSVTIVPAPGVTRHVRIAVAAVAGTRESGQVGFSTVALGVDQSRTLVVPGRAGPNTTMLFSANGPRRACTYPSRICDAAQFENAEEAAALDRTFRVGTSGFWRLSIGAVARPSLATAQLLQPVQRGFSVTGSSILDGDPVVAPAFALDGNPATSWVSAATDTTPTLRLQWPGQRQISRIQIGSGTQNDVRLPTAVIIRSGSQVRRVSLTAGSLGFFDPIRTDHATLTFVSGSVEHPIGTGTPMEISEVAITGLGGLTYAPDPASSTGQPCGFGPPVNVDGRRLPTRVTGTLGDVLAGTPLTVSLCGPRAHGAVLALAAGGHRLRVTSTAQFQAVRVVLRPYFPTGSETGPTRALRVDQWGSTSRRVSLGPGGASVLWVPENANPGWVATADGHLLAPIAVDGWMQGWHVPAGGPVTVSLHFTPQREYVATMLAGAVVLLGLGLIPLVLWWRRRRRADDRPIRTGDPSRTPGPLSWLGIAVMSVLAGFGVLVGAVLGSVPGIDRRDVRRGLVVVGLVVAACWQAGPAPSLWPDLVASTAVGIALAPGRGAVGRLPSWLRASNRRLLQRQEQSR